MQPFQLNLVADEGDVLLVKTVGHITPEIPSSKNDHLVALLGPDVYQRIVLLSLADSDFMGSTGLAWLLYMSKRFGEDGGKLVLHSLTRVVTTVIKAMRLDAKFSIAPDLATARAMAQGNQP